MGAVAAVSCALPARLPGVRRLLGRTGLVDDAVDGATMDTWADTEPVLAGHWR